MLQEFAPDMDLGIAPEVMSAMAAFAWPGNLRQLSHVLRTAVALMDQHESQIHWIHLPDDMVQDLQTSKSQQVSASPAQNLYEVSRKAIQQALENARGNVSAAARQLGISRQTLYRKLQ
jgi:transcriptional regulator with PAS, ATPase and Fis domain